MMEKDEIGPARDKLPPSPDATPVHGEAVATKAGLGRRIIDSFKRDPNAHVSVRSSGDGKSFDIEHAAQKTAASPLQRKLKGRHLQMIAIGGSIGIIPVFFFFIFFVFIFLFFRSFSRL